jgi:hypothetical protein
VIFFGGMYKLHTHEHKSNASGRSLYSAHFMHTQIAACFQFLAWLYKVYGELSYSPTSYDSSCFFIMYMKCKYIKTFIQAVFYYVNFPLILSDRQTLFFYSPCCCYSTCIYSRWAELIKVYKAMYIWFKKTIVWILKSLLQKCVDEINMVIYYLKSEWPMHKIVAKWINPYLK